MLKSYANDNSIIYDRFLNKEGRCRCQCTCKTINRMWCVSVCVTRAYYTVLIASSGETQSTYVRRDVIKTCQIAGCMYNAQRLSGSLGFGACAQLLHMHTHTSPDDEATTVSANGMDFYQMWHSHPVHRIMF